MKTARKRFEKCSGTAAKSSLNAQSVKSAVKEALVEILQDHRELLQPILAEALEDLAMAEAIRQGKKSKHVNRDEVLGCFSGK